jgi:Family of unknown function (DUF6502)
LRISHPILVNACLRLLRPLARIALRHGLSSYDFSRIANIAFVAGARDILREQGKPLSFSRVSTITGLHRHVVSNIVNLIESGSVEPPMDREYQRNRLARVLSGWFDSPQYTDQEGRPLILPVEGPEPSFASLVHAFSGDIYPKIILEELIEVGAVRQLKDGSVRAVARRYTSGGAEPAAIEQLGATVRDHLGTLEHNLGQPADSRLFDDSVVSVNLDRAALPLFRRLLRQRGAAFLEDIQGWVAEHERPGSPDTVRAGVMVQMFVEPVPSTDREPIEQKSA